MNTEKIKTSILGFIVGDALGVPYEFTDRNHRKRYPVTKMTDGGIWQQPIGTWSDDSSMLLATVDSLCDGYNLTDLAIRFDSWLYHQQYTPHGEVFDVGAQTHDGLSRIHMLIEVNHVITPMPADVNEYKNGNGSLMRILPFGFYLKNHSIAERWKIINEASSLTHSHIRSVIGCFIYSELVIELISGTDKALAYKNVQDRASVFLKSVASLKEVKLYDRILKMNILDLKEPDIQSTPYVLHTLEAVLWCFLNNGSYEDCVLSGINLGGDTDTIGGLIGGLAGIIYTVPEIWIQQLARKEEIIDKIDFYAYRLKG
jgi:ADP-ribosylglycohydrolase